MSLWTLRGGRKLYTDLEVQHMLAANKRDVLHFEPADFADWERVYGVAYVRNRP